MAVLALKKREGGGDHLGIVGNCFDILGFQIRCALEAFQRRAEGLQVVGEAYVPGCVG